MPPSEETPWGTSPLDLRSDIGYYAHAMMLSTNSNPWVLFAEDQDDDAYFLERAVDKSGLDVNMERASDGQAAVDYLTAASRFGTKPWPRLLLLDLSMPRLNGFEVLTWIKDQPDLNALPVIVLSGSGIESDVSRARELGADEYCVKPSRPSDLTGFVRQLIARWLAKDCRVEPAKRSAERMSNVQDTPSLSPAGIAK